MRVLVTGSTGFVGRRVVEQLEHAQWDVIPHSSKIGDFGDADSVRDLLKGVDTVVHLAWTSVPASSGRNTTDVEQNVIGSLNLINECIAADAKRIVFMSSGGTVYGEPESLPISEAHLTRPISSYGITKLTVEHYLSTLSKAAGIESVILRGANAYGPGHNFNKDQGVVGTWLRCLQNSNAIKIFGDGSVVRDFVFVDDFARAVVAAVKSTACEGVFNIGSGEGYSLNELLTMIQEITQKRVRIDRLPSRGFDVPANVLDNDLAKQYLNWEPVTSIEEGIKKTWDAINSLVHE